MNKESETRENHGGERIDELQREIAELRDALKKEKQRTALTARSQQRLDDVREREAAHIFKSIEELRDKIETSNRPALMRIAESVALLY